MMRYFSNSLSAYNLACSVVTRPASVNMGLHPNYNIWWHNFSRQQQYVGISDKLNLLVVPDFGIYSANVPLWLNGPCQKGWQWLLSEPKCIVFVQYFYSFFFTLQLEYQEFHGTVMYLKLFFLFHFKFVLLLWFLED